MSVLAWQAGPPQRAEEDRGGAAAEGTVSFQNVMFVFAA